MVDAAFWKNKKVFLTGHTGFKGSWISLWLQNMGAEVCGFALSPPTDPSLFELAEVANGMVSRIGDIGNLPHLQTSMSEFSPEIVFHMAAQPLVRYSYQNPVETFQTNVMGTVHVLESARKINSVKVVINVTTDKCYENKEWHWGYRETEPMGGYDPYSSSKGCSELITSSYRQSFFSEQNISLASARAGNVIGGGDWASDRLVPDMIRCLIANEQLVIRSPNAFRPWQHVLEPLSGYLVLAERMYLNPKKYCEAYNFGPNDTDVENVKSLADSILSHWPNHSGYKIENANLHEAHYLKLDCSKAKAELDWTPKLNLKQTVKLLADWYQAVAVDKRNARRITLEQINYYQNKLKSSESIK